MLWGRGLLHGIVILILADWGDDARRFAASCSVGCCER